MYLKDIVLYPNVTNKKSSFPYNQFIKQSNEKYIEICKTHRILT
ncbi:hypothetical protein GGQ57_001348 [Parabacteroides faecis]|uniref:Uncharacterized protein n=1 Tax=Parabacteroides faecis TaxID=1217282 RepID=A0ABR6KJA5_9BACT|nr:hypothetical protein [Parabacteroides faecis]